MFGSDASYELMVAVLCPDSRCDQLTLPRCVMCTVCREARTRCALLPQSVLEIVFTL